MKNFWVKAGIVILAAALFGCRKEVPEVEPDKGGDEEEVIPTTGPIAKIVVVTDGGAAVDSKDPKDYRPCSITVDWLYDNARIVNVRGKIRGRGNSTWHWYPKKPYRIKLDESAEMVGLPKNKDWVLLADYRDVTHMMNATGFYLARELGIPHTNHIRYVTLELNGKDMGLYALTEQVEEGGNRVPLNSSEGILLALDINDGPADEPDATNNFYSKVFGMAAAVKFPEEVTSVQRDIVKREFAKLEKAIDELDWDTVQELLDVDSMIHYIMVQEIIGNVEMDNNPSLRSGFIHRHDNKSRWVMGPLWDCDGGFSYNWGDMYDYSGWGHTFFENYQYLVFGSDPFNHRGAYGSTASDFFCRLFGIPEFVQRFQARWNETHTQLLTGLLAYLDEVEDIIADAAQDDMDLWGITNYEHEKEYKKLCTWLRNRFGYLDGVIKRYPTESEKPGPSPSQDAQIKATLSLEASYAQDGHHEGTWIALSDSDKNTIASGLGISFADLYDLYGSGYIGFWAVEPDGKFNPQNTANAPGHWFNAQGYVTPYGQDSYIFSEYDLWYEGFSLGKHPAITTPGKYNIAQAFVYGDNAVKVEFEITITE